MVIVTNPCLYVDSLVNKYLDSDTIFCNFALCMWILTIKRWLKCSCNKWINMTNDKKKHISLDLQNSFIIFFFCNHTVVSPLSFNFEVYQTFHIIQFGITVSYSTKALWGSWKTKEQNVCNQDMLSWTDIQRKHTTGSTKKQRTD